MGINIKRWTQHPIALEEFAYQQRSIGNRRRRWWRTLPTYFMLTLSIFAIVFVIMISFGEALGLFSLRYLPPEWAWFGFIVWLVIPGIVLMPTTVLLHFGLMFRTVLWTSNSIPREKVTGTWDLLLLTGASARAIVLSKWWATVVRTFPAYLRLSVLRYACLLWFIQWTRVTWSFRPTLNFGFSRYDGDELSLVPLLLGFILLLIFTCSNLLVTSAIGMLAAFITRRGGWNTGLALVLRTVFFVAPFFVFYLAIVFFHVYSYFDYRSFGYYLYYATQTASTSLLDNGVIVVGNITTLRTHIEGWETQVVAMTFSTAVTVLWHGFISALSLWGALRLALRQEALAAAKNQRTQHSLAEANYSSRASVNKQ